MKHSLLTIIAGASLLALLGACQSTDSNNDQALERKADALENKADRVRDQGEARADAIERSDPGMDSESTDDAAARVRENTERRADELEDRSDDVRDQK